MTKFSLSSHLRPEHSFGCNNNKSLRPRPHLNSLLVSLFAALLVIASASFGVLFAWRAGSKHDALLGVISVAMALGLEGAKPFAIDGAFRSLRQLRIVQSAALALVGALAVMFSLQAELSFAAMTRGDMVAERAGEADVALRAEQRYRRAETELAAIKPTGTSKIATSAYLSRREALQNELRQAEQDRRAAPAAVVADPGAVALSTYARALGFKTDAQTLGLWLPLVGVLALEIGAAFAVVLVRATSVPAVSSVTASPVLPPESPTLTGDAVAHKSAESVHTRKSGPPKTKRRDRRPPDADAGRGPPKRGLSGLIETMKANGGVIDLSQRKLARKLGASRTTLQRALNDLAEAGAVILDTSKAGTRLALA